MSRPTKKSARRIRIRQNHIRLAKQYLTWCEKLLGSVLKEIPLSYAQWVHPQMRNHYEGLT